MKTTKIIRDIRGWDLNMLQNTDEEYHQLITELMRQEDPTLTFQQFWDESVGDCDGTVGGALTSLSLFLACAPDLVGICLGGKVPTFN